MQTPSNHTIGAAFPAPPAITPATPTAAPMTAFESQRVRLQNLQGSVNLQGVPSDTRGALQRTIEVEALIGLHDINPLYAASSLALLRIVRAATTPDGLPVVDGHPAGELPPPWPFPAPGLPPLPPPLPLVLLPPLLDPPPPPPLRPPRSARRLAAHNAYFPNPWALSGFEWSAWSEFK